MGDITTGQITTGKIVAYVRVSTEDQKLDGQIEILKKHYDFQKLYQEKINGKDLNRPVFEEMVSFLQAGDTLVVHSWSTLSRSFKDLLQTINFLEKKGVSLKSYSEQFDLNTSQGKLMLGVLGSCFEFERALMLDRQRIGIAFAKKEGKFKGKPHAKKPENFDVFAEKYLRATRFDRYPFKEFLKDVGLKSSLARKFLKTYKENKIKENESKNLIETNIQKI